MNGAIIGKRFCSCSGLSIGSWRCTTLEESFWQEMERYEEEHKMPYITSVERIVMRRGVLQTAREDVITILEARFEEVPSPLMETIHRLEDPTLLKTLLRRAATLGSVEEFAQAVGEHA